MNQTICADTSRREIKFGTLVDQVATKPRHFLATGHYARCMRKRHATRLCRAKDMDKDQTYYLSSISEDQLKRVRVGSERASERAGKRAWKLAWKRTWKRTL
jgi:tRNA U34 2-thiouridine synthase MnmA/TrmU